MERAISYTSEITPLIDRSFSSRQISYYPQDAYIDEDPDYSHFIQEAEEAILQGIYPLRIKKGSSGSYFVLNIAGVCNYTIWQ